VDEPKDNIVPLLQHQRDEEQFLENIVNGRNAEMVYTVYSAWIDALDGD